MSEINRDMLMALLDGQLDEPTRAKVEIWLAANPDAMAELGQLQRQSDAIRTLYGPVISEPVPARLSPRTMAAEQTRRLWRSLSRAAMIVGLLGIGLATGWLLRPAIEGPAIYERLIADAVSAHNVYVAESRHAVEVSGEEAEHLFNWLSNRLDTALAMPDLSEAGLVFLGGRLLPAPALPGGRAAQLMYEDAAGQRATLYITPAIAAGGPDLETLRLGGDNVLYWASPSVTCTIVGPQSPEALEALAAIAFTQLTPSAPVPVYREL